MTDFMTEPIRIMLVSGSIRRPSYTCSLAGSVSEALTEHGAITTEWDLSDVPLPIADPSFHHNPSLHSDELVRKFVALADQCDAFVLASPVYHNSYSGVIKNALDHLAIPHFQYKPVGLIGHGGNRSTQAVDHLRIVIRGLSGIAIPTQVCTAVSDYSEFGAGEYKLNAEDIRRRIEHFSLELIIFAQQLRLVRYRMRIQS